ncbi:uncharacterized protein PgNI_04021, partial [Pyricularia grisea]|uniref:Uncharacterized protein n=1 Tax=Pyricularia grisea TaxID=148305 RepID=A0A6P8BBK0_PYRGI
PYLTPWQAQVPGQLLLSSKLFVEILDCWWGPSSLMWDIPVKSKLFTTYSTGWVRYTSAPDAMTAPGFTM